MPLFDKKDKGRYAAFTRRSLGLGAGMTAVFGVLAGRLYQLQIREGDEYKADGREQSRFRTVAGAAAGTDSRPLRP